jgi:hypothetical protein
VIFPRILSTFGIYRDIIYKSKVFNQRKNKRFSYKPRFKDSNSDGYREESKRDLEAKWNELRSNTKRRGNIFTSLPALIIILISLFVLIYILNRYM